MAVNQKNKHHRNFGPSVEIKGDKEVLERSIDSLSLPSDTLELLKNNRFNTVYDIAKRTERDMFRVQTFNKKHLTAVRNAIKAVGIDFLPFVPRSEAVYEGTRQETAAEGNAAAPKPQQKGRNTDKQNNRRQDTRLPQSGKNVRRDNVRTGAGREEGLNSQRGKEKQRPQIEKRPKVELPLEEWIKVCKNGKWGFNNGLTTVIYPKFDEVFSFKDDVACVDVDGKFGYINPQGEFVIEPQYECALSFSEGMAVFFEGEKCGYINKENIVVIAPKFDAATAFENGRAKVKDAGKWQTIDVDGNVVWSK